MKEFEANNENDYLPLRDVVFNTLRTSILTGELKPGERLMEIHLADKLGVSRTPIREAIRDRDRQTGAEAIKNHIDNQEKAVIRMITSASGKTKR